MPSNGLIGIRTPGRPERPHRRPQTSGACAATRGHSSWVVRLTTVFAAIVIITSGWGAQLAGPNQDLPDLGSPANAAVSIADEYRAGQAAVHAMREQGQFIEDPEINDYIQTIGHSLSSRAEEGQHQFTYLVARDPVINAFAMPGGFIVVFSGLILATRNENELAGVMGHETAHVTQRHLVKRLIDQSHAGLISTAAMLAAVLLGATVGRGNPGAMEGAILGTQGAAIQHQINYTRIQEYEADRIGISTMAAAEYDPLGMASFFEQLSQNSPNPERLSAIQFLIDHPLSADRVAEARNRAAQLGRIYHTDSLSYLLMRERLRSMVGDPKAVRDRYVNLRNNSAGLDVEQRYGMAVSEVAMGDPGAAIPELLALLHDYRGVDQYYGALGQAYLANGQLAQSKQVLEQAIGLFPRNAPITLRLAETLMKIGENERAKQILDDLFNQVEPTPSQAKLIARAAGAAGDLADSNYYMADYYLMGGDLKMAAGQLQTALTLPNLNPIQRARISALLEEVHTAMPKNRKDSSDW
jgi:beta-barrel assembly-enhancing protease